MAKWKQKNLDPIILRPQDWAATERVLLQIFRERIYLPLLEEAGDEAAKIITNAGVDFDDPVIAGLRAGTLNFYQGRFSGQLNAAISMTLRKLGATFDRRNGQYRIRKEELPMAYQAEISASDFYFRKKMERIDAKLSEILPGKFTEQFKLSRIFDHNLNQTDKRFEASVKSIIVVPEVTKQTKAYFSDNWTENMDRYINEFTQKQIIKLRGEVQKSVFAGNRRDSLAKLIQDSYRVSVEKARFLAKQETSLLIASFKQARYLEAGVNEYRWRSVVGSIAHQVRPRHKELDRQSTGGKLFRYDDPPNTAEKGKPAKYNNPGEDFNCRCHDTPVVRV